MLPDWAGMWRDLQMLWCAFTTCRDRLGTQAHMPSRSLTSRHSGWEVAGRGLLTLITSSEKSLGCGDVNLIRISGHATAHSCRSSANESAPLRLFSGLYTELNPCTSSSKALGTHVQELLLFEPSQ